MKLSTEEKIKAQAMIDYGSRFEQLNGRILLYGMESLTDEEQVEFHLHYYKPKKGMDVQALARNLTEKFGGMDKLAVLSAEELMQAEGMYRSLAQRFTGYGKLLQAFARYERSYQKIYIRSTAELCRFVLPLYRQSRLPGTWQLCLSEGYELVYCREITPSLAWGEQDSVENSLHDMEYASAKFSIIVQMRGREFADPKLYDREHAALHAGRLSRMGCSLLDVVMIDEGKITSMYELGMMPDGKSSANRQLYLDEDAYFDELRIKE